MKSLDKKYREDKLTHDELLELRKRINSDEIGELESVIESAWMTEDMDVSKVDSAQINRMQHSIDRVIRKKRFPHHLYIKIARIAAVVMLPLFMLASFYLYRENKQLNAEEMVIFTGKGERANITLPDGTCVVLNAETTLEYSPQTYNRKERKIRFEGEAYFQVNKNENCPFLIDALGLQVKVLGTSFNLLSRKDNRTAELALEEGSVLFTSLRLKNGVVLKPKQKAVMSRITGEVIVLTQEAEDASAWKRGDLLFRNVKLSDVLKTIEDSYGVTIRMNLKENLNDGFTGVLPISDLNEVFEILEKSYHVKATISCKNITLDTF